MCMEKRDLKLLQLQCYICRKVDAAHTCGWLKFNQSISYEHSMLDLSTEVKFGKRHGRAYKLDVFPVTELTAA